MSAELKTSGIEFIEVGGIEARQFDPEIEWPEDSRVVLAIENGEMVGRSSLSAIPMASILNFSFVEGSWVHESKRGTSLAYRLLKKVENVFRSNGKTHALAMAHDDQPAIGDYLIRFGYARLPVTVYVKQLVKE